MTFVLKPVNSYALAKFKKTLMYSGKEYLKWLTTQTSVFAREFSILFAMEVQSTYKKRSIKLYPSSITTGIRT